ncbi:MAG TPA: ABC transporter permease [Gammaproteobacteria bacterium]
MLVHYLTIALAAHRRRPLPARLGVATLAVGLACFLAAYGVASFWGRADRHFAHSERIFAVTSDWEFREVRDGAEFRSGVVPATNPWLAAYLRADFPALEAVARVVRLDSAGTVRTGSPAGGPAVRLRGLAADGELLRILDLPFAAGDGRRALDEPASVVLTRAAAERLFGDEPALGRTVLLGNRWEAAVTGVLEPIPEPSHLGASAGAPLRFDLIASWDLFERASAADGFDIAHMPEDWSAQFVTTYVLLPADGSLTAGGLQAALPAFAERHVPPAAHERVAIRLGLVPLTALLRMAVDESLFSRHSGISITTILLLLGGLVLAVACVDFANLAAARAARRAREVGLRKTLGATTARVLRHE